jgi:hypothetical protein
MQFYLPSKFNSANVPKPNRGDVKILTLKEVIMLYLDISGRASDRNFLNIKKF